MVFDFCAEEQMQVFESKVPVKSKPVPGINKRNVHRCRAGFLLQGDCCVQSPSPAYPKFLVKAKLQQVK